MAIGSADVHKAVNLIWTQHNLDAAFRATWDGPVSDAGEFVVLHDDVASPAQPFSYCVYEVGPGNTIARMTSSEKNQNRELHNYPLTFDIHAKQIKNSGKSPKLVAAELAEQIMVYFGGHPSNKPSKLELDNGCSVIIQYTTDFSVRKTGEDEHQWRVNYVVQVDVPVAV